MKILFLDDERMPEDVTWLRYPKDSEFTIVRTVEAFAKAVADNEAFDIWSLDHDLGTEATGYDALKHAIRWMPYRTPAIVWPHTKNIVGGKNITEYWKNYEAYILNCNRRSL
jgi:hypothetical protein